MQRNIVHIAFYSTDMPVILENLSELVLNILILLNSNILMCL